KSPRTFCQRGGTQKQNDQANGEESGGKRGWQAVSPHQQAGENDANQCQRQNCTIRHGLTLEPNERRPGRFPISCYAVPEIVDRRSPPNLHTAARAVAAAVV